MTDDYLLAGMLLVATGYGLLPFTWLATLLLAAGVALVILQRTTGVSLCVAVQQLTVLNYCRLYQLMGAPAC